MAGAGTSLLFVWSALVHTAVILAILKLQGLASRVARPKGARYSIISEFLFSTAWVVMSLENNILSVMWSVMSGVVALGLRIFVTSLIFQGVYGNPCQALYFYLSHWPTKRLATFTRLVFAQMLAIPVGVTVTLILWRVLAVISVDYSNFFDKEVVYFLSVHPVVGFLIEAAISLLTFLPRIFIRSSMFRKSVEAILVMFLVGQFGMLTGAFMNPMAALSSYLMWHWRYLGAWDIFVHVFVFIFGPLVGTVIAVGVAKCSSGWKDQQSSPSTINSDFFSRNE